VAQLRGYLKEARKTPKGVTETGKGAEGLTDAQRASLCRLIRRNPRFKKDVDIIRYSDGSAIFTFRKPADNTPRSFRVYEKRVDKVGNIVSLNGITVGSRGEKVHTKLKLEE